MRESQPDRVPGLDLAVAVDKEVDRRPPVRHGKVVVVSRRHGLAGVVGSAVGEGQNGLAQVEQDA